MVLDNVSYCHLLVAPQVYARWWGGWGCGFPGWGGGMGGYGGSYHIHGYHVHPVGEYGGGGY
ncbi:MAG: hypothetical protein WBZ36_14435 [Candidatus Nitrosopolaris sp.]